MTRDEYVRKAAERLRELAPPPAAAPADQGEAVNNRKIFRYVVPVDDRWHTIALSGDIVHVASRREDAVEFWAINDDGQLVVDRAFRVFGTGQPIPPAAATYVGTAFTAGGLLVWHLMEHEQPVPKEERP